MIAESVALDLARRFAASPSDEAALATFRAEHPGLRFLACSEDDIPARLSPWLTAEGVELYLMDATEHCVRLSRDPENACGLVFARLVEAD
ncbi:MAG: hypothetical protein JNM61_02695 [Zoogloeaceae bacterium]|nr:hypothetical protein [Zoogloeaceae bacterium]